MLSWSRTLAPELLPLRLPCTSTVPGTLTVGDMRWVVWDGEFRVERRLTVADRGLRPLGTWIERLEWVPSSASITAETSGGSAAAAALSSATIWGREKGGMRVGMEVQAGREVDVTNRHCVPRIIIKEATVNQSCEGAFQ